MEKMQFVCLKAFLVLSFSFQVQGNKYQLICPMNYKATGQSWYAEHHKSLGDYSFTYELGKVGSTYKPSKFIICVICTYGSDERNEVENCIGHQAIKETNLAYERIRKSDKLAYGTLVWSDEVDPIGLEVDMSKRDLLSTLQANTALTNIGQQSLYLNCPDGFKIKNFKERPPLVKNYGSRKCIICSGYQFTFSSCVVWDNGFCYKSLRLPNLYTYAVPTVLSLMASGMYLSPYDFSWEFSNLKAEYFKLDCAGVDEAKGKKIDTLFGF